MVCFAFMFRIYRDEGSEQLWLKYQVSSVSLRGILVSRNRLELSKSPLSVCCIGVLQELFVFIKIFDILLFLEFPETFPARNSPISSSSPKMLQPSWTTLKLFRVFELVGLSNFPVIRWTLRMFKLFVNNLQRLNFLKYSDFPGTFKSLRTLGMYRVTFEVEETPRVFCNVRAVWNFAEVSTLPNPQEIPSISNRFWSIKSLVFFHSFLKATWRYWFEITFIKTSLFPRVHAYTFFHFLGYENYVCACSHRFAGCTERARYSPGKR